MTSNLLRYIKYFVWKWNFHFGKLVEVVLDGYVRFTKSSLIQAKLQVSVYNITCSFAYRAWAQDVVAFLQTKHLGSARPLNSLYLSAI